uniref:Secretory carrier-associated membrane protein n=1 Tax=Oryzias sinensis TaxID=183150 RepID=A0A8C7Y7B7_9TELE
MSKCKSWWFLNTCAGEKEYPGTGAIIIPDSSSRQPAHELSLPDKELGFKTIQSGFGGPDVSVTQATSGATESIGGYNPFSSTEMYSGTTIPISAASSQPAVLQTSVEQSPQATAAAAQAKLEKQQEELEKKAAELERKEQELQNRNARSTGGENNWPPLPRFCPVKPCFYQDFEEEISEDYRQICKRMYYLWMCNATLFLNVLACLAYFTADPAYGVDFGLSI